MATVGTVYAAKKDYSGMNIKYEVVMKRRTWKNALKACRAMPGGDLVSIVTKKALRKVRNLIRNTKKTMIQKFWVGKAGNWYWIIENKKITYY